MTLKAQGQARRTRNTAPLYQYGIACLAVVVALLARLLLDPLLGERLQLFTLYAAVLFVAWYLGRGPATLTLLLGLLGLVYAVIEPRYTFAVADSADFLTITFYAVLSGVIIALIEQLRIALRRADAHAAEARRSEDELADLFENASIGLHCVGPDGRIVRVNRAELAMLGYSRDEYLGRALEDLTEDPAAMRALLEQLKRGDVIHEHPARLRCKDGSFRDVLIDSSARFDDGVFVHSRCFTRDVTEQKRAEAARHEGDTRFRQLADAMPQIVWTAGANGEVDYLNRRWTEYTGLPETIGNPGWSQVMHPDDLARARKLWAGSQQDGAAFELEVRLLEHATRAYRWHLMRTVPVHDEAGEVMRWFGTATDIDLQKRAEEAAHYLAEASALLAEVEDYETTLQKVADLAVPYFADWSAVDVANADGSLRRLAVAHREPEKIALVQRVQEEYPPDPDSPNGTYAVLRSRKPQIFSVIPDELLVQAARDARHLELIRSLGLKSFICVPLVVSGRAMGVFSFATAESGRHYTNADLVMAENLASRASVAIENAELYQALREADRRKDEFLATLAHELRNPLAPLSNSLQILKVPNLDPQIVAQSRDMMERQVHLLVRLVDDLLDVSRVTAGKIDLHRERVALAKIVDLAVETVRPQLDSQRHRLQVAMADTDLVLDADRVRLAQVIGNILANAAKYSEPGSDIALSAAREGNEVVLRIRDNGIGIDKAMLARIFQLFVQADHATSKAQGGLGIGLTLARNLVEMHGGNIEARSEGRGKGSEFILRLPLASPAPAAHPAGARQDVSAETSSMPRNVSVPPLRLLVVDDNEDAAMSLASLLKLQRHEVRVEHSGPAALQLSANYKPDVVFLDIGMPGMDGLELARRLRQAPGLERVVLVAVTGWGQEEDRRRTREAGFSHHLVKPPEAGDIQRVLAAARNGISA